MESEAYQWGRWERGGVSVSASGVHVAGTCLQMQLGWEYLDARRMLAAGAPPPMEVGTKRGLDQLESVLTPLGWINWRWGGRWLRSRRAPPKQRVSLSETVGPQVGSFEMRWQCCH